jgi:type VI secretion system Hcp family effector
LRSLGGVAKSRNGFGQKQKEEKAMAEMFLSLRNKGNKQVVHGESLDDAKPQKHRDEIEIHNWTWQVQNTADAQAGKSTSKLNAKNIVIFKHCDTASKGILQHCALGTTFDRAKITCRKQFGEERFEYLYIHLEDVKIHEIDWTGVEEGLVKEKITLEFGKFQFRYRPQPNKEADWGAGAFEFAWDIQKNEEGNFDEDSSDVF